MRYLGTNGVQLIEWVPIWIIAALLMIPHLVVIYGWMTKEYVAQGLFYAGLFLPGAIKRRKWRHALVMLVLAALAYGLDVGLAKLRFPANRFWRAWLFNTVVAVMVGGGEMIARRPRSRSLFIWTMAVGLGVGVIASSAALLTHFEEVILRIPMSGGARRWIALDQVVYPLALAIVIWIAVPMARRMPDAGVRRRMVVGGFSLAMAGAYVIFFGSIVFVLAESSLQGRGPYRPLIGAEISAAAQSEGGYEVIWHAMEYSDWSRYYYEEEYSGDWRPWIIKSSYKRDPAKTATRLAQMLQRHPSRVLAEYASAILLREKRYDAYPWLIRYAALPRSSFDVALADALAEARVPQAFLGEVHFWALDEKGRLILLEDWAGSDRFLGQGVDTFKKLFDTEVPATRHEAMELFWRMQGKVKSPMPPLQQAEVARLMDCLKRYLDAWQGENFDIQTPEPDWDHAQIEELEKQVDEQVRTLAMARNASGELPPSRFAVVMIDEATEAELGPFPYDRAVLAKGIEALADAKARGVALKFFIDLRKSTEGDAALAKAMTKVKVILQARMDDSQPDANPLSERFVVTKRGGAEVGTIAGKSGWLPLPELSQNAYDLGFIDSPPSIELVPMVEEYQGKYVKSLYLAALELARGERAKITQTYAVEMNTKQNGAFVPKFRVELGGREIATDKHCFARIKLPPADNLRAYSFIDLIHGKIPPERLADRVVILGYDGAKMETNKTSIGMVKGHRLFCYQLFSLNREVGFTSDGIRDPATFEEN